jgi:hypothetical protein
MAAPVRVKRVITNQQYLSRGLRAMAGVAGAIVRYKTATLKWSFKQRRRMRSSLRTL